MIKKHKIGRMGQLLRFYLAVVLFTTLLACYFSCAKQYAELIGGMDNSLLRLEGEYSSIAENFWDVYLPVFEQDDGVALKHYFMTDAPVTPYETFELKTVMRRMAQRDNRIRWVAVYSAARSENYIFYNENSTLQKLPEDFTYRDALQNKTDVFEILSTSNRELVLAGGPPLGSGQGSVLIAYDTTTLSQMSEKFRALQGLRFAIVRGQELLLGDDDAPELQGRLPAPGEKALVRDDGQLYMVSVCEQTPQNSRLYYAVPYWQVIAKSNRHTPMIFLIVSVLLVVSLAMYRYVMNHINREVGYLRAGLEELGQNHLDYRIAENFTQPDFAQIAEAVNGMAQSLQENIDRVQEYQQKQREAEMQELQAKFNPHFLYNSLDMFRARCYENGDEETADLIADTAAIFRGFINPQTFIPLREEMAFSRRYLSLFRARYGDAVEILYDMDPEIMDYGIIRNVFQPIIENYFVHGIDTSRQDNTLCFKGRMADEKTMCISVEDNGQGMPQEELEKLNAKLQEPIASEKESYGLKNLSQRIRLFYGDGYGLQLHNNLSGGLTLEMRVAPIFCREAGQGSRS